MQGLRQSGKRERRVIARGVQPQVVFAAQFHASGGFVAKV
jgi:hypothetical protein